MRGRDGRDVVRYVLQMAESGVTSFEAVDGSGTTWTLVGDDATRTATLYEDGVEYQTVPLDH